MDLLGPSELLRAPTRRPGTLLIVPIRAGLGRGLGGRRRDGTRPIAPPLRPKLAPTISLNLSQIEVTVPQRLTYEQNLKEAVKNSLPPTETALRYRGALKLARGARGAEKQRRGALKKIRRRDPRED